MWLHRLWFSLLVSPVGSAEGIYNVFFIFFCEIQVPLLTSMGEEERALVKAIESGDTDLVYFSIFHIWRQVSTSLFVWV